MILTATAASERTEPGHGEWISTKVTVSDEGLVKETTCYDGIYARESYTRTNRSRRQLSPEALYELRSLIARDFQMTERGGTEGVSWTIRAGNHTVTGSADELPLSRMMDLVVPHRPDTKQPE